MQIDYLIDPTIKYDEFVCGYYSGPKIAEAYGLNVIHHLKEGTGDYLIIHNRYSWSINDLINIIRLSNYKHIYFRIVDDYDLEANILLRERYNVLCNLFNKVSVLPTYEADYSKHFRTTKFFFRYPYYEECELPFAPIKRGVLINGNMNPKFYKARNLVWMSKDIMYPYTKLNHPGYVDLTGKALQHNIVGPEFIKFLQNNYCCVAGCNQKYELIKYLECAYAGVIPIGDLPNSLKGNERLEAIIREFNDPESCAYEINNILRYCDEVLDGMRRDYRAIMRSIRNPKVLREYLENGIRNER